MGPTWSCTAAGGPFPRSWELPLYCHIGLQCLCTGHSAHPILQHFALSGPTVSRLMMFLVTMTTSISGASLPFIWDRPVHPSLGNCLLRAYSTGSVCPGCVFIHDFSRCCLTRPPQFLNSLCVSVCEPWKQTKLLQ